MAVGTADGRRRIEWYAILDSDASEITLECIGRPAPRTASAPTMRFGYHPHAVRVRLEMALALIRGLAMTRAVLGARAVQSRWRAMRAHLAALLAE